MGNSYSVAAQKIWQKANNRATPPHLRKSLIKEGNQQALNDTFGVGHKTDRHGNPIEQGIGAAANQSRQSIESYKKYHKGDPDYEETIKRMEAELAACNEKRRDDD